MRTSAKLYSSQQLSSALRELNSVRKRSSYAIAAQAYIVKDVREAHNLKTRSENSRKTKGGEAMNKCSTENFIGMTVVMETGTHSPWMSEMLEVGLGTILFI